MTIDIEVQAVLMEKGRLSPLGAAFHITSVGKEGVNLALSIMTVENISRVLDPKSLKDDNLRGLYKSRGISDNMLLELKQNIISAFLGKNIHKTKSLPSVSDLLDHFS